MTPDQINEFFSFLYEGRIGAVTPWLRLIAGILTSAFAAAIVVITIKYRRLFAGTPASAPAEPAVSKEDTARPWREVQQKINSPNASDWNLAVIQADAILDEVLQGMGLGGATMGERLKQLDRSKLASLDGAWEAHKLRNRIAHESERALAYAEARRAVMLYGEALKELGYLEE